MCYDKPFLCTGKCSEGIISDRDDPQLGANTPRNFTILTTTCISVITRYVGVLLSLESSLSQGQGSFIRDR